tara:strand:+ start:7807 stop:8211 length:405 start_codon:yes stop_codon:yes gene_type:complete
MKYLILALTLFASSAFADANTPTAKAVCGQVYGHEVCAWGDYPAFNDEYGIRASYRSDSGNWIFLAHPSHFISNMADKDSTDFYFKTFVAAINTQIETKLKPISTVEPNSGIERVQWLTAQLSFSSNQLVYSPQ